MLNICNVIYINVRWLKYLSRLKKTWLIPKSIQRMECTTAFSCNFTTHCPFTRTWTRKSTWPSWLAIQLRATATTRDFRADCTRPVRTLRGFKACTTFGRKYCWASRNVTEAVVSSPTFLWILPRLWLMRHDVYERVTSRRCRAYGDTRRERHAIVAIFNATGACLVCPWNVNFSYLNRGQCCWRKLSCPRQTREKRNT